MEWVGGEGEEPKRGAGRQGGGDAGAVLIVRVHFHSHGYLIIPPQYGGWPSGPSDSIDHPPPPPPSTTIILAPK